MVHQVLYVFLQVGIKVSRLESKMARQTEFMFHPCTGTKALYKLYGP